MAFFGSIPITDISKILNLVLCFVIKNVMYSVPYLFFKNFKNQDLWATFLQIAAISIFCYDFLINLINDDAFVSAAMANACLIPLVCLFMKTHLLALLQVTVLTWFVVFSCTSCYKAKADKISQTVDTDIPVKPKYQPDISARPIFQSIFKPRVHFFCFFLNKTSR